MGASERVPVGREDVLGGGEEGHLEVLQWARQNGCPWDANTWYFAKSNCRAYLREHGCPGAA